MPIQSFPVFIFFFFCTYVTKKKARPRSPLFLSIEIRIFFFFRIDAKSIFYQTMSRQQFRIFEKKIHRFTSMWVSIINKRKKDQMFLILHLVVNDADIFAWWSSRQTRMNVWRRLNWRSIEISSVSLWRNEFDKR